MMWLVISYDFPSDDPAAYRHFRKNLLKNGFSFVQKSLCWRWVHSPEKAASICGKLLPVLSSGKILLWQIPDNVFASASCWNNGSPDAIPAPPDPWLIV